MFSRIKVSFSYKLGYFSFTTVSCRYCVLSIILSIIFCNNTLYLSYLTEGFPGGSYGKESACIAEDSSSIPESGRSPGEGNGYPLQYFCLENSMDRRTWWSIVNGAAKTPTQLNNSLTSQDSV